MARREQDEVEQLRQILERHLDDLSEPQREILVESFFEGGKRADIAAHRGITVSTYDNHRQAAFKALRESLAAEAKASTGIDRSIWYDRVEELIERRAARLQDRSSSKKGKSSTSKANAPALEANASASEGIRDSSRGDAHSGERANSEGERGNSRDERRHVEANVASYKAQHAAPKANAPTQHTNAVTINPTETQMSR